MPDENGTETTRPDEPSADESLFGDAAGKADDEPAAVVEEEAADKGTEQNAQGSNGTGESADAGDKPDAEAQTDATEELKVVVSIKGGRATIGVQQPSSDPHIETFADHDLPTLAQEVVAVTERARGQWEETPKHPAYVRPAPPARRLQGARQTATAETQEAETQQQTLRLF